MARTITQWRDIIVAAKNSKPVLNDINNPSAQAIWIEWINVIASVITFLDQQWDIVKTELRYLTLGNIVGTKAWYELLALNWNYLGSNIITRVSCIENGTKVLLKVAKNATSGSLYTNLTLTEKIELQKYINSKKIMGTDIDVVSQSADLLSFIITVRYTGVSATVEAAVKLAVKDYLNNLAPSTELSKAQLNDYLFEVAGVVDVWIEETKVSFGLGYNTILTNYVPTDAGYYEIGKDSGGSDLLTINMTV